MSRIEQAVEEANSEAKRAKHYVAFILDRSTSMTSIREEAVDAFNRQVEQTKKTLEGNKDIDVEVSLVTFSTQVDTPEIWCKPLEQMQPITREDFVPSGWTAMYDAIGFTVNKLKEQKDIDDPMTTVLMIVVSDGHENYSRNFGAHAISQLMSDVQETKRWTVVYEGANIDLAAVQGATGIAQANTMLFQADAGGMRTQTATRARASQAYYRNLSGSVAVACAAPADAYGADERSLDMSEVSFYNQTEKLHLQLLIALDQNYFLHHNQ